MLAGSYISPEFLNSLPLAPVQLREFAVWCAEDVLRFVEDRYPNETRPRDAVYTSKCVLWWKSEDNIEAVRKAQRESWDAAREIFKPGAVDLTRPVFAGGARDAADAAYFAAFVCGFVAGDTDAFVAHYGAFVHPSVRAKHKAEFTRRYENEGSHGS